MAKRKSRSQADKNLRKYKYAIVYNTYGNDAIATRARDWSFATIYDRLGISIEPKKVYRAPQIRKTKTNRRTTYHDNFLKHRANGWPVDQAFQLRTTKSLPRLSAGYGVETPPQWYDQWAFKNRKGDWSQWSSSESFNRFPGWIVEWAISLNQKNGMKANARFGFAVMKFVYVDRWLLEEALDYVVPDPASRYDYKYNGEVRI